ncbi:hypothetical protein L9F63_012101, partial [Diploptera punctata]
EIVEKVKVVKIERGKYGLKLKGTKNIKIEELMQKTEENSCKREKWIKKIRREIVEKWKNEQTREEGKNSLMGKKLIKSEELVQNTGNISKKEQMDKNSRERKSLKIGRDGKKVRRKFKREK